MQKANQTFAKCCAPRACTNPVRLIDSSGVPCTHAPVNSVSLAVLVVPGKLNEPCVRCEGTTAVSPSSFAEPAAAGTRRLQPRLRRLGVAGYKPPAAIASERPPLLCSFHPDEAEILDHEDDGLAATAPESRVRRPLPREAPVEVLPPG